MSDVCPPEGLDQLIAGFEHTAFRLEVRSKYGVDYETEPWLRWRVGEPDDMTWLAGWTTIVQRATAAGKRIERVRLVGEQLTDYQRFALDMCRHNTVAGEDIRYLRREHAADLGVPTDQDWWLLDSARLAHILFDTDDRLLGGQILDEPHTVQRCCAWRDALWHYAIPYQRYVADLTT